VVERKNKDKKKKKIIDVSSAIDWLDDLYPRMKNGKCEVEGRK